MISFSKTLINTIKSVDKRSSIDTLELILPRSYGSGKELSYAERVILGGITFTQMELMYVVNDWLRAIIDKIVERVTNIQPIVKPVTALVDENDQIKRSTEKRMDRVRKLLNKPNDNNESFSNIRKKLTRDISIYDAAGLEIIRGIENGKLNLELYTVPGNTIKINVNEFGLLGSPAYSQIDRRFKVVTSWEKDELVYMMMNPRSNRAYGLSPMESLVSTVTADLYTSAYNLDFYYNNATPRIAVLLEGMGTGQGSTAMQRFREWWDSELKGKPHRPIILGTENGQIKIDSISKTNEEMQFFKYALFLISKMMSVYKMQPVIMPIISSDLNINRNDAKEQNMQFKADVVYPHNRMFAEAFNRQIIFSQGGFGYDDVFLDFDLDLIDRGEQSKIDQVYSRLGVLTINDIRKALGMIPVSWGNVPYLQNNVSPFGIEGNALPRNPNEQTNPAGGNAPTPEPPKVPNIATAGKAEIESYIMAKGSVPIGWEKMELNERIRVIMGIYKKRNQELSKLYSFGG